MRKYNNLSEILENEQKRVDFWASNFPTMKYLVFSLLLTLSTNLAFTQMKVFRVDSLPTQGVLLKEGWKFHAGDNPEWAKADFDDSKWESIDPTKDIYDLPQLRETHVAWLRLRVSLSSKLYNESLAFSLIQTGASELFLDGDKIAHYGTLGANSMQVNAATQLWGTFVPFKIDTSTIHIIAVRFALQPNLRYQKLTPTSTNGCFTLQIVNTGGISRFFLTDKAYLDYLKLGIFFILAVLHLAYYWYFRSYKANLYFFYLAFGNFTLFILNLSRREVVSIFWKTVRLIVINVNVLWIGICFLLTIYAIFQQKRGEIFWFWMLFLVASVLIITLGYGWGWLFWDIICPTIIFFEVIRFQWLTRKNPLQYTSIIMVGSLIYMLGYGCHGLILGGFISPWPSNIWQDLSFNLGILCLPISISLYLGLNISRSLEDKLKETKELAAEKERSLLRQNSELQAALLEGQTTERKRIAADLHDNLSSTLTAVRWNLMALTKQTLNEKERKVYDDALAMTTTAHDQVRLISHNLLPEELEKEGLFRALERLVSKLNRSGTVHFELKINDLEERLSKKMEFELYSIILELTHNITKHSGATEATVEFKAESEKLKVIVSDNGQGLAENRQKGMGIQNVESRIKSLNGQWKMHSTAGQGVVFEAEFG